MKRRGENLSSNEEPNPIQIVGVYAQNDETFYLQLKKRLYLWERQGFLSWLEILPGSDRSATWHAFIEYADVILLFLSPDFFPDEYCYQAMQDALQEKVSRPVVVIPTLIRAVHWRTSPCKHLAVVPQNEKPIASWPSLDEAYQSVCADLVRLIPAWQSSMLFPTIRSRLFQARDLPKSYVSRPKVFKELKRLLLDHQSNRTTAITTALRGAGGFGKTTLALALCHDAEIQAAFPDGILWVELGEHPPRPLDVLNGILASVEPSLFGAITLEETRNRWRVALSDRVCLLVIDDVWQRLTLEPLLEGGPQCMRLVTTRNDQVLPEEAVRLFVDAMEPEEAIAVLCRGLSGEIQQEAYQSRLLALASRLGYWPLLLTLAHGLLIDQVRYGRTIASALEVVEYAYQSHGVVAFHLERESARHQTVERCLGVSLRHIEEFAPPRHQAAARYQELAIFPEDTDIPLTTLYTYWQGTAGLSLWEVDELCIRLHQMSLLLTCDLSKGVIRLHDVMRSYLVQHAGPNLPALHSRLLDAYWQTLDLKRWADLPPTETYLWHHLILHLFQASRRETLQTTLTDLLYLTREALYVGVSALETNLWLTSASPPANAVDHAPPFFASLHRNVAHISHLLRQVQTEAEMGGLLLSHLGWQPPFVGQWLSLEQELPRPFLLAWCPLPEGLSSALLRTLHGHTSYVSGCAVSPDGLFIVSSSSDETLKLWDTITGEVRLTLIGHTDRVTDCAVSPDGLFIVSASRDQTLKLWDATTGEVRLTLIGHTDWVTGCAVSPDGHTIISASDNGALKVWDAITGEERLTLIGHTGGVTGCAVSPDGLFIVSASHDKTLKVWDAATGEERLTLIGHISWVTDCVVSPDGGTIISASDDSALMVWDATTGEVRLTLLGHVGRVTDCAVSPDGGTIISASDDKTLKLWDAAAGEERFILQGYADYAADCAVSPDGRSIIFVSHYETLKVWNVATGEERLTLPDHSDGVTCCAISPGGRTIVSASWNGMLKLWDVTTGGVRLALRGHANSVGDCAVSPDGLFIVSASHDETLKVWDAATGEERLTLIGHTKGVICCAISPDGLFIVSASYDKTLKLWDAATGEERKTLTGHTGEVRGCTVSPDGHFIVSTSNDKTLKVWDVQTGQCLLTFPVNGALLGCAFHPDGEHLVACGALGMYFFRLVV